MSRPRKHRCCRRYRNDRIYKPVGVPLRELEVTTLELDAFEALRLCDAEGLDQAAAAAHMAVSRGTVQRLLAHARREVARALVARRALSINLTTNMNPELQEDAHACLHSDRRRYRP